MLRKISRKRKIARKNRMIDLRQFLGPDQSWSLSRIVKEAIPATWEPLFHAAANDLQVIASRVESGSNDWLNVGGQQNCLPDFSFNTPVQQMSHQKPVPYFPLKADIFRAFQLVPLQQVKVVIIGQDPYPSFGYLPNPEMPGFNYPKATGLAFSVRRGDEVPKSLENIFEELESTVPGFRRPTHGDLTRWALQGVLLLNQSLTVPEGYANAHVSYWSGFLKRTLELIQISNPKVIFVLWGGEAKKLRKFLYKNITVLEAGHPSPLSVKYFRGCNHFPQINQILRSTGQAEIDWNLD